MIERFQPRAIVSEDSERLRICIPAWRDWGAILFLIAWLCFWTILAFQSQHDPRRHFGLGPWIVWAFGALWAIYTILHTMGAEEVVTGNATNLTRRLQIFGVGFTRSYRVAESRNLRFQPGQAAGGGACAAELLLSMAPPRRLSHTRSMEQRLSLC